MPPWEVSRPRQGRAASALSAALPTGGSKTPSPRGQVEDEILSPSSATARSVSHPAESRSPFRQIVLPDRSSDDGSPWTERTGQLRFIGLTRCAARTRRCISKMRRSWEHAMCVYHEQLRSGEVLHNNQTCACRTLVSTRARTILLGARFGTELATAAPVAAAQKANGSLV